MPFYCTHTHTHTVFCLVDVFPVCISRYADIKNTFEVSVSNVLSFGIDSEPPFENMCQIIPDFEQVELIIICMQELIVY